MKIFRVVVRGQFADLDEAQRGALLDRAGEHSYLKSAFTKDGTLTYDEQLVAFNFRYEVRHGEPVPDEATIGATSIERATTTLRGMGLTAKHLRFTVTDMATIWN